MIRTVVAEFLSENGLKMVEAENAERALALLDRCSDVKLLFTDINMPGDMDGLALAKEVHRRWPEMLVMLTSGRGGVPKSAMPAGGEFVAKPYDFENLVERIRKILRH
ncbi:hypothetical protein GCM10007874_40040 [Labrys miyagiensis]|uniref:Response regulatory domain-containing protein n=2 Tax=Labrys miyagiensis TaxID=346912 RepID=A0ABQ6CKV8_9HYPH|nr:hypothetical protein GCM10007874_40040 [Labrys miyagiensis]